MAGEMEAAAAQLEGEAAGLDRLAERLEAEAAPLGERLDAPTRVLTEDVWRGPAATRAREDLLLGRRRLGDAAAMLLQVAALVRRRAGDRRVRADVLRRQAAQLRATAPT